MTEYICVYDDDDMQYIPSPYEEKTELVRCKNCRFWPNTRKFWNQPGYLKQSYPSCTLMEEGDFCSKGKEWEE